MTSYPRKKKVLFLTAKMSLGGAERVISNLANKMSKDAEVHTLLLLDRSDNDYFIEGNVTSLNDGVKRNRLKEILYYSLNIKKYIKENDIDYLISFMEYPNLLSLIIPLKTKRIISVRNHMSKKWKGRKGAFWRFSFRFLYPKADIVISPTKVITQDLVDVYNIPLNNIKIINNPYDIEKINESIFEEIESEYAEWFNGYTIITMGNLNEAKGHHHLIRVFAKLSIEIPNAKLVILGDGPDKRKLIDLTESLSIASKVLFLGFQKNPHKYIARSKLYVLSSYYEGFPNALAEAMACGLPVISTDCKSGPREILAPESNINHISKGIEYAKFGILITEFRKEVLATEFNLSLEEKNLLRTVKELFENELLYEHYREKSQERIKDFHINIVTKEWLDLLRN